MGGVAVVVSEPLQEDVRFDASLLLQQEEQVLLEPSMCCDFFEAKDEEGTRKAGAGENAGNTRARAGGRADGQTDGRTREGGVLVEKKTEINFGGVRSDASISFSCICAEK